MGAGYSYQRSKDVLLFERGSSRLHRKPALQIEAKPEPEKAEHIIGEGPESVYVYYYPVYKKLARLQGKSNWPCKIGRTKGKVTGRVIGQGTALPETPRLAIVWKTDKSEKCEQLLHDFFKSVGKHMPEAPGHEWFVTTPEKILKYIRFLLNN